MLREKRSQTFDLARDDRREIAVFDGQLDLIRARVLMERAHEVGQRRGRAPDRVRALAGAFERTFREVALHACSEGHDPAHGCEQVMGDHVRVGIELSVAVLERAPLLLFAQQLFVKLHFDDAALQLRSRFALSVGPGL